MRGGEVEFCVRGWSAWAPGLAEPEQWRDWARAPWSPVGDSAPALAEVPPMQRRRIDLLGRMAIQTALWCEEPADEAVPLVFASRHGDVARSLKLLESLAQDEAMSPAGFGLSVHNAIAALYSIVRGHRGNYLALAAGRATAEAACVEAAGLLADGAPEVRVVVYDAVLPDVFAEFVDEPDPCFAWCWRLGPAAGEGVRLSLGWNGDADAVGSDVDAAAGDAALPHGLDVHRFLLSGARGLAFDDEACRWSWRRHA